MAPKWIPVVILELIHAQYSNFKERICLLVPESILALPELVMTYGIRMDHAALAGDLSFMFLTYQLLMGRYWLPIAMTGNGELGFDSGEGA